MRAWATIDAALPPLQAGPVALAAAFAAFLLTLLAFGLGARLRRRHRAALRAYRAVARAAAADGVVTARERAFLATLAAALALSAGEAARVERAAFRRARVV